MENAEEILQCLDEFTKLRPKEIPPELEYYLSFVARTGDPVYQWSLIKCLFREKLLNVITEFYEACPSIEIPPCPNVELFNYEAMKCFILEKLDTFAAAPFTVQRICELLTSPRKEYNRIDKYMRALEKNILVVSTREPGNRKSTENGESIVNGLENEHGSQEMVNNAMNSDINVEVDMDDKTVWQKINVITTEEPYITETSKTCTTTTTTTTTAAAVTTTTETVITTRQINYVGSYTSEVMNETPPPPDSAATCVDDVTKIDECSTTNQIIIAEPITPPEQQQQQQQQSDEPKTTSNETIISSSDDVVQLPTQEKVSVIETEPSSISTSTSSVVVVIGPDDMQVEDISPEPEQTDNNSPIVPETTTREETIITPPSPTNPSSPPPKEEDDDGDVKTEEPSEKIHEENVDD